jgi:hypothetical protein
MRRPAPVVAALALGLLPLQAHALCEEERGPADPARIGAGPAGFGSLPEACPASDLALQGDASLLDAAEEDFYGSVTAALAIRGRYALDDRLWVSAWLPGPQFLYVANATVDTSQVELGPSALGLHASLPVTKSARLAPFARALVPTETVYRNATRYGFDHGFTFEYRVKEQLDLLSGMSPRRLTPRCSTWPAAPPSVSNTCSERAVGASGARGTSRHPSSYSTSRGSPPATRPPRRASA